MRTLVRPRLLSRRSSEARTSGDDDTTTARIGRLLALLSRSREASRRMQRAAFSMASSTSHCERFPARQSLKARTCNARCKGCSRPSLPSVHLTACNNGSAGFSNSPRRAPNKFGRDALLGKQPPLNNAMRSRSCRLADLSKSWTPVKA
eukprot:scaffold168580_cov30-Tisochrysis_lutea.AAC.2